jgi:hypothetical protein
VGVECIRPPSTPSHEGHNWVEVQAHQKAKTIHLYEQSLNFHIQGLHNSHISIVGTIHPTFPNSL